MLSHFHLYGELRSSGVMGRRNGPSGLCDDDDDDDLHTTLFLYYRVVNMLFYSCICALVSHYMYCCCYQMSTGTYFSLNGLTLVLSTYLSV